jgi:hypothetical protein
MKCQKLDQADSEMHLNQVMTLMKKSLMIALLTLYLFFKLQQSEWNLTTLFLILVLSRIFIV